LRDFHLVGADGSLWLSWFREIEAIVFETGIAANLARQDGKPA
jgi:hypothetical protein